MQTKTFYIYDIDNPAVQEAYAMLTANLHIRDRDKQNVFKTFVLTSYHPEEGRTSLAISLAISMAQIGLNVLLVDADMRKPSAEKRMSQGSLYGLSDYLNGEVDLQDALCQTNISNLMFLSCGKDPANPMALLSSPNFEIFMGNAKRAFDIVLFDTPALSSVVDGALVAGKADGTLLVVKAGSTGLASLKRIKEQIENLNGNVFGVVLNKVKKRDYRIYYKSYNYFFRSKRFFDSKKLISSNTVADISG